MIVCNFPGRNWNIAITSENGTRFYQDRQSMALPAGSHKIWLSCAGVQITKSVDITANKELKIDFIDEVKKLASNVHQDLTGPRAL